jgi:hypothetical protein
MQIRWNKTGEVSEVHHVDGLRAIRRRLAVMVKATVEPSPEPVEDEAEVSSADSD